MFKETLIIGQYYPTASPIHELHGGGKIIASLVCMIVLFIVDTWYGWGAMALLAAGCIAAAHLPLAAVWRGLRVILIFCLFTLVFNVFFYPGDPLVEWGFITITGQGISYGFAMSLRLILLVLFGSLLTLTTKPTALTDAIEGLMAPLRLFGVHTQDIAMMIGIAIRFIPTVMEEFRRIVLAQRARGAGVSQGNIFRRAKAFIPMLVPLFVASFRRAEELASAMDAKCYRGGEKRSKWKRAPWRGRDTFTVVFSVLLLAGAIVYRVLD